MDAPSLKCFGRGEVAARVDPGFADLSVEVTSVLDEAAVDVDPRDSLP